ncbi:putative sucrose-phosphate synthase 3 [Bienertia sinuspersici]
MNKIMEECVNLRIWHGGLFNVTNKGLEYIGGKARTFPLTSTSYVGFKRVYDDKEVLEMCDVVLENRGIDLFSIHNMSNTPTIDPLALTTQDTLSQPSVTFEAHEQEKHPKSSPSSQNIVDDEYYQWYEFRPHSPIPLKDLNPSFESEGSDLEVEEEFGFHLEHENEDFEEDGFDSTVDELREARERKKANAEFFEISQQVDYANSEEDELTPDEDGDGEGNARSRRGNHSKMLLQDMRSSKEEI